ncbi:MAG: hypothetical protein R3D82_16090 [Xanthobacteraceae bacterium]
MTLPPEDVTAMMSGPAIYADRALISVGGAVRLTFVEQTPDGPMFRVAVALPHQVAVQFANVLKATLADIEKSIAEAEVEAEARTKAAKTNV